MGINRGTVLELINDVHRSGGFKDYNSYSHLFDQVDTMPESKEDAEPHWIPVTEEPKESGKYLVTAVISFIPDHVDDPNTYEAVTTAYYSADARNLIKWWGSDGKNNVEKVLAWMPLPAPYQPKREVTE